MTDANTARLTRRTTGRLWKRAWFIWLSAFVLASPSVAAEQIYPGYDWREIGDGIYVHGAVNPLAGPCDGNSVIIVNDDDVVVVDTHINPAVARAVIGKIRQLTDKAVSTVVNTHWHDDHTNGNHAYREAFPDTRIVAHRATLEALREEWPAMEAQRQEAYANYEPEQLLAAADKLENSNKAIGYRVYAGYIAALKPELPNMQLVYPDTVFEDRLELHGKTRRIIVEWLGRGNTDGDVVVWLPDDKILVTGDLLVAPVPFAFESPMTDWVDTLQRLAEKNAEILVPGHGAVQYSDRYLKQVSSLLQHTLDAVRKAQENDAAFSELSAAVDLSEFEQQFTGGDAEKAYAWQSYFLRPGLKSAWMALGFPVPSDD